MNVIKRFIFLTLIFSCLLNQAVAKSEYDIYQKDFSPKKLVFTRKTTGYSL